MAYHALQGLGKFVSLLTECKSNQLKNYKNFGYFLSLFAALVGINAQKVSAVEATWDYSVQVSVTTQVQPPQIKLTWLQDTTTSPLSYDVYRKSLSDTSWTSISHLGGNVTTYTDVNVSVGAAYEYQIVKTTSLYKGFGYVYAGINVPLVDDRGKIVLVVDSSFTTSLQSELTRLQQDLVGDGWTVIRHDVSRTATVPSVKALIKTDYSADPSHVKAVFLFGHVPVPYSGNIVPDGHSPDHYGAWPADVYYGDMDGLWTDTTVNNTGAKDAANHNVPGDGKFDQSTPPAPVKLQVGRVDLANLPGKYSWDGPATFPGELELLRNYLNKDHKFRSGLMSIPRRGIVGDFFGIRGGEAFGASGWRNMAPFFGSANIKTISTQGEWINDLSQNTYLWAYGCGAGSYSTISGLGTSGNYNEVWTTDIVNKDAKAVFFMLFGSWLGDWDSDDNIMRSVLATSSYGLTCSWSGRPHWYYQHMALGENIGFAARLTQNNGANGLYQTQRNSAAGSIHIALMGDPSLRMHPVGMPSNLQVANAGSSANLSWTVSTDSVVGYHVYRATSLTGPFVRLTNTPVTGTTYSDTAAISPAVYMVRAVKLETSASGSYFNASQGIFVTNTNGSVVSLPTVSISATKANASEAGPTAGEFTISRTGSTTSSLVVNVGFTGSATNGSDYQSVSGQYTIPAGAAAVKIPITPIDDSLVEGSETVVAKIATTAQYLVNGQDNATVTIADNDSAGTSNLPVVNISTTIPSATEGGGNGAFTFTRSGASTSSALTVNFVLSGTAGKWVDYRRPEGDMPVSMTIPAGSTSVVMGIVAVDDGVTESNETLIVTIKPDASYSVGTQSAATMTIVDKALADTTKPTVAMSSPSQSAKIAGSAVNLTATASDNIGVVGVQFAVDGTNVGSEATSSPYTTTYDSTKITDGNHVITATARDAAGNTATCPGVTVTVANTVTTSSGNVVWVEDSLPQGAVPSADGGDAWNWISASPSAESGTTSHQANLAAGSHQHFFDWATQKLDVGTGETLYAYVYLDPSNLPSEIMLQWNDGSWDHRAYWGQNKISYGTDGTTGRHYMGALPEAGKWVRLSVPAKDVALEGSSLKGMAFSLYDGRASWDQAGKYKIAPSTASEFVWVDDSLPAGAVTYSKGGDSWNWITSDPNPYSGTKAAQSNIAAEMHQHYFNYATDTMVVNTGDKLFAYIYLDPANIPQEIMLHWNDGSWNHRAYWGANNIALGTDGTSGRFYMGPIPEAGKWVRLEVSAKDMALEGRTVQGMAFTLYSGRATWDKAGVAKALLNTLPSVTIKATDSAASEKNADPGVFTITRSGSTANSLTVNYTIGGTALNGVDYQTLAKTVTIPAGSSSINVTVKPIDDSLAESTETVILSLATSPTYVIGIGNRATVNIEDNDSITLLPTVSLEATTPNASEANQTAGVFTITRTGVLTDSLTVGLNIGGTATNGTDYSTIPGSIVIPAGSSSVELKVTPTDDALVEGDETVTLSLSSSSSYILVSTTPKTITIADNDSAVQLPEVTVGASNASVTESNSSGTNFTVSRTGPTTSSLTVSYQISGTATNGTDYEFISSAVVIPAGASSVSVPVKPKEDTLVEGTETVVLKLSTSANYTVGSTDSATINVTDNDTAQIPAFNVIDYCNLQLPVIGDHGIHILSPNILELEYVNTKDPDPARVLDWDFVDASYGLTLPASSEFVVNVNGTQVAVTSVGFKRRPLYAPLVKRDLRIDNHLYLVLAANVKDGDKVEVKNPSAKLWSAGTQYACVANPLRYSPAIHVNQEGYVPTMTKKAMVGFYLGSMGEMDIPSSGGFKLVDANTGNSVYQGNLTARPDIGYVYTATPYQKVYQADFSDFKTPGEYMLVVPGMGASLPFLIDDGIAMSFARAYALGLYHQRCGTDNVLPYTRFTHDACHTAKAEVPVPVSDYANTWSFITAANADYASNPRHTAPQLKDEASMLYPFINKGTIDVSGGHHDAGDYSKYTINSAGLVHYLMFAVDNFPGVAALDNLGIPESGDGVSDLMQEAKLEADYISKLQDADGGFYFIVYPKNRKYENNVTPDRGDTQVVWPKNTSATAAAVAALAETASSPAFKAKYPTVAAHYLDQAKLGWTFLTNAIAKYGKDGSYQKITFYGDVFMHDDELAWAASAMFVATGDDAYQQKLMEWFDPSDPATRHWGWWRMWEGYGRATRTFAFAARNGRLPSTKLNPTFLAKCEAETIAAGDDHVKRANDNAYGTSFPTETKHVRAAGWYFSSERAFDCTVAYQLKPLAAYIDTILSNLNYEGGTNPINVSYITGLGWKRQREIVHQYAQNDRRIMPPSGIPLGNIQAAFGYLDNYKSELGALTYPQDGANNSPYPFYDRWADTFNVSTEFVHLDQARGLASIAYLATMTPLKNQAWKSAKAVINVPAGTISIGTPVTVTLDCPGMDLNGARIVWEAQDQEPCYGGTTYTFTPKTNGTPWIEAEVQWPDGRRAFATNSVLSTNGLPSVGIVTTDGTASETGPDPAVFTFTRTGSTANSLTVNFQFSGTAAKWFDYKRKEGDIPSSIVIPAGQSSATFTIYPIDDTVVEGTETVTINISPDLNYNVGSASSASATITDND